MSEELVQKLRVVPTASHFLKPAHLYQDLIAERAEAADRIQGLEDVLEEKRLAVNGLRSALSAAQARLSEAVKVLEDMSDLVVRAKKITPNHLVNWHYSAELALSQAKAFLATLGEENER